MRGTPVRQVDFTGGLNTKDSPYLTNPNECRDCLNVVTTVRGSIKKRNGIDTIANSGFNAAETQLLGLWAFQGVPTAGNILITGGDSGRLYTVTPFLGGTVTNVAGTGQFPNQASMIQAPAAGGQGPIYYSDINNSLQWTGSGSFAAWTATSGTVPTGSYMVYFKNRVWIAGNSANPSTLYFSDIGSPRVWPAANVVQFDPSDNEPITGIGTAGPYLLVFKANKCWAVYDPDTGANRPLSRNIGCSAHRSIVETPLGTFFYSADRREIYITNGQKLTKISDKITPSLASANQGGPAGGWMSGHYYLSVSDGLTTPNKTFDYDSTTKSWWKHSNASWQFANLGTSDVYSTNSQFYSIVPGVVRLERLYSTGTIQDNGSNISTQWTGPWLTFNEPYRNKRIRQVRVDGQGTVDAYTGKDFLAQSSTTLFKSDIFNYSAAVTLFGGSGNFGGTGSFGDQPGTFKANLYTLGVCRAFTFEIRSTSGNPFEMDSYTTFINLRNN